MDLTEDEQFIQPAVDVLRIKPLVYNVSLFTFLGIAIAAGAARTGLRVWRFRRIDADDIFLLLSVMFLAGGVVVAWDARDLSYLQMSLSLELVESAPADFGMRMAMLQLLNDIGGILTWLSIFSVKLSFLFFFKKLVTRVQYLDKYWWVAFGAVLVGTAANVAMGFIICPHFGPDAVQICTIAGQTQREGIYLDVSTAIDIVTDLMIIAVPVALLWRVKIDLRRKLALGTVCSLSAVMIVLAIIRVALAPVRSPVQTDNPPVTDSLWLFVFQNIEASVAVVMVSITAFRSMLGQKNQSRKDSADSERDLVTQPAPVSFVNMQQHGSSFGNLSQNHSFISEGALQQRERNQSVWSSPPQPTGMREYISRPLPVPPPKDPKGPLPPRRQFGSMDSQYEQRGWNEGMRQAPNPHAFV